MQKWLKNLTVVGLLSTSFVARAGTVTPDELAETRRWTAARFEGIVPVQPAERALLVRANHDAVQKNARGGKPLRLVDRQFTRGLFCHAPSKLLVRLPASGRTFTATVGVDSNEQTSGGRGSVDFSVSVEAAEKFRSGVMREGMDAKRVSVELGGATEFVLAVDPTPDGIACDQADWAEAKVTLTDGRELWLADLPLKDERARRLFSADLISIEAIAETLPDSSALQDYLRDV